MGAITTWAWGTSIVACLHFILFLSVDSHIFGGFLECRNKSRYGFMNLCRYLHSLIHPLLKLGWALDIWRALSHWLEILFQSYDLLLLFCLFVLSLWCFCIQVLLVVCNVGCCYEVLVLLPKCDWQFHLMYALLICIFLCCHGFWPVELLGWSVMSIQGIGQHRWCSVPILHVPFYVCIFFVD